MNKGLAQTAVALDFLPDTDAATPSLVALPTPDTSDFLLWQLADSAFPTGGFAHSGGLEAAWQHGEIRNRTELISFIETSLSQLGHAILPFVTSVHGESERFAELDRLLDAYTTNHVANRASRLQGRAFLASAERIFGIPVMKPPCGHFPITWGFVTQVLKIDRASTVRIYFFQHVRALTASAVRLGIAGPIEAQGIQYRMAGRLTEIISRCHHLTLDDVAQTSPLLEIWQGTQDRLYSRLFQS
jgi:urease accessory protein